MTDDKAADAASASVRATTLYVEAVETHRRLTAERNACVCDHESGPEVDREGYEIGAGEPPCWKWQTRVHYRHDGSEGEEVDESEPHGGHDRAMWCESCQRRHGLNEQRKAAAKKIGPAYRRLRLAMRAA